MIMSSSICRHFSTFPFVKLIEQFNELKSFGRRGKNSSLLSLLLNLVTTARCSGLKRGLHLPPSHSYPSHTHTHTPKGLGTTRTREGQTEHSRTPYSSGHLILYLLFLNRRKKKKKECSLSLFPEYGQPGDASLKLRRAPKWSSAHIDTV